MSALCLGLPAVLAGAPACTVIPGGLCVELLTCSLLQDGSCNGLQHYAALGRDSVGAASVNLLPSELPQDVYSGVAAQVGAWAPGTCPTQGLGCSGSLTYECLAHPGPWPVLWL